MEDKLAEMTLADVKRDVALCMGDDGDDKHKIS